MASLFHAAHLALSGSMPPASARDHAAAASRMLAQLSEESRTKEFCHWVSSSLSRGASGAHRWSKRPYSAAPAPALPINPPAEAESLLDAWAKVWWATPSSTPYAHHSEWLQALDPLRALRLDPASAPPSRADIERLFTAPRVLQACASFKRNTPLGAEGLPFALIITLPHPALLECCSFLVGISIGRPPFKPC